MSKSNLNLSRSEAVRLHREMWRWIADELEKMSKLSTAELEEHELYCLDLEDIKEEFCRRKGKKYKNVAYFCFCCEYSDQRLKLIHKSPSDNNYPLHNCYFCPLKWGSETNVDDYYCMDKEKYDDFHGLYELCNNEIILAMRLRINYFHYLDASQYAKQIAELPEKDVNAELATMIAEDRGIIDYKVKGNRMIYYANWKETQEYDVTYKVTIRLDTLKEERQKLNKYYQKGNINRCK